MQCPVCNENLEISSENLEKDFYYDCQNCHSSLFFQKGACKVLVENSLKKDKNLEEEDKLELTEVPELSVEQQVEEPEALEEEVEAPQEEAVFQEEEAQAPQEEPEMESLETSEDENLEQARQEEPSLDPPLKEEGGLNSDPPSGEAAESLEDFSEVTNYGNESGLGEEGVFYYNLTLSEIDSEDIRAKVSSILSDDLLQLDSEKNDLKIKNGVLKLDEISPVKVFVIVKSLMGLPVKIFWEQKLIVDKT